MLKYNFHLKSGAAKARMCMAASVAVSTMTLGYTGQYYSGGGYSVRGTDSGRWIRGSGGQQNG